MKAKQKLITVKVDDEERARWHQVASVRGVKLSALIRGHLERLANRDLRASKKESQ